MGEVIEVEGIAAERSGGARRSLRIAVVTETWPPEINGVATTLSRVVDGIAGRGHDIQIVRPRQASDVDGARDARFDQVLTPGLPIPRHPNLKLGLPAGRRLLHLWSRTRPDVVHIATEGPLGWSALGVAGQLGLPTSSDFRTNFHTYADHYGVGWLRAPVASYLRRFHNRTGATTVPTEALRRELASLGFQRLAVVARGVDRVQFDPSRRDPVLRAAWGAAPDDLVVAVVGRLAPEKNLDTVRLAFDAICTARPRSRLLLVGDGPLAPRLREAWPDTIFAGPRRGTDLAAHYASADLFLFPSLTETFGNVTTEAMASGLPVVAFDYAAAASVIDHGVDGLRVPFGDQAAFVSAAVGAAVDPVLRERLGRQARIASGAWGWDAIVVRVEALLLRVATAGVPASDAAGVRASTVPP